MADLTSEQLDDLEGYFDCVWADNMAHELHEKERACILRRIHVLSEFECLTIMEQQEVEQQIDDLYSQLRKTYE